MEVDYARGLVVDKRAALLLDRFRVVAAQVTRVSITDRFGIPQQTIYRYLQPEYYPSRRLDPKAEGRLRDCVDTLEVELGISRDVPRETTVVAERSPGYGKRPSLSLEEKAACFDEIVRLIAARLATAGLSPDGAAELVQDLAVQTVEVERPQPPPEEESEDRKAR